MRLGGVKLAAEQMELSQPMISRLLMSLEKDIGFALFLRKRNRLLPSPEAFQYHQAVTRTLSGLRELEEEAAAIAHAQVGHLVIAAQPIFCDTFLLDALSAFRAAHPGVSVRLIDVGMAEMLRLISERRCDMALGITLEAESFGALTTPLARCEARCIMPRGHAQDQPGDIPLPRLRHEAFIELAQGSPLRTRIDNMMQTIRVRRDIVAELRTLHGVVKLVERGLGIAIVDPVASMLLDPDRVSEHPLIPRISWEIAQFVPRDRPLSKIGEAFSAAIAHQVQLLKDRGLVH